MKPETAMYVEEAYQRARAETWGAFEIAYLQPLSDEQMDIIKTRRNAVLELGGKYLKDLYYNPEEHSELYDEDAQKIIAEYLVARQSSVNTRRAIQTDWATRKVVADIVSGLTRIENSTETSLKVRFNFDMEVRGKLIGPEGRCPSQDTSSIPSFVAYHPETTSKETGIHFAATTTWLVGKMLTPPLVDVVLADETRQKPTIVRKLGKHIGLIERDSEDG